MTYEQIFGCIRKSLYSKAPNLLCLEWHFWKTKCLAKLRYMVVVCLTFHCGILNTVEEIWTTKYLLLICNRQTDRPNCDSFISSSNFVYRGTSFKMKKERNLTTHIQYFYRWLLRSLKTNGRWPGTKHFHNLSAECRPLVSNLAGVD